MNKKLKLLIIGTLTISILFIAFSFYSNSHFNLEKYCKKDKLFAQYIETSFAFAEDHKVIIDGNNYEMRIYLNTDTENEELMKKNLNTTAKELYHELKHGTHLDDITATITVKQPSGTYSATYGHQ